MKDSVSVRFPVIDAFKAIASQLIVLHHLAAYGPIADAVQQGSPALIGWLYDYARMAVQVFFVIGGFLAARAMLAKTSSMSWLTVSLINRYLRLVVPFCFALVLAILCAVVARDLLSDSFIPDWPELSQLLSHVFLVHGILDHAALSAGVWFIAVDFQLFALMLVIVWLGGKVTDSGKIMLALVTLMAAASLFWFNRDSGYDDWAIYFFGAYGLGAVAYWASQRESLAPWFVLIVVIAATSLFVDFRLRILIAVCVALVLFFTKDLHVKQERTLQNVMHYLGTISYALFLVHFSVVMLANAVFAWFKFSTSLSGHLFMLMAWFASLILADFFYLRLEQPATSALKLRVPQ